MKASQYYIPFKEDIDKWEVVLLTIQDTIDILLAVQKSWMYLENVFIGQADIKKQLPSESTDFEKVHREFKREMKRLFDTKNAKLGLCHKGFFD